MSNIDVPQGTPLRVGNAERTAHLIPSLLTNDVACPALSESNLATSAKKENTHTRRSIAPYTSKG
jgi:hypothetical protein